MSVSPDRARRLFGLFDLKMLRHFSHRFVELSKRLL